MKQRLRVELTFSSGKFIAWDDVTNLKFVENKKYMVLEINNPNVIQNHVDVLVDKLDFYEVFVKEARTDLE